MRADRLHCFCSFFFLLKTPLFFWISGGSEGLQVRVDPGEAQDFDSTVENLQSKVTSLRRVCASPPAAEPGLRLEPLVPVQLAGHIDEETKHRGRLIDELVRGLSSPNGQNHSDTTCLSVLRVLSVTTLRVAGSWVLQGAGVN